MRIYLRQENFLNVLRFPEILQEEEREILYVLRECFGLFELLRKQPLPSSFSLDPFCR